MTGETSAEMDPYTAKSQNDDLTLQQKVDGLRTILSNAKTGMLTTRDVNGIMHSRAMAPCEGMMHFQNIDRLLTPRMLFNRCAIAKSGMQITLVFIANNKSHKFEEIKHDEHVNVSFLDEKSTSWASFAGIASIINDRDTIKEHWTALCVLISFLL